MTNTTKELQDEINRLRDENEKLKRELSMAAKLKYHLIPNLYPAFPDVPEVDIFADTIEVSQSGGDFHDFFRIDADHIGIVIADIFEGGIAAALYMVAFKIYLTTRLSLDDEVGEKISAVNDYLCWKNEDNLCLSAWYGIYEISTGTLRAVNAGHEQTLVMKGERAAGCESEVVSYLLGVIDNVPYESYEIKLEPGDKLLLYTDGVINAKDIGGRKYGLKNLKIDFEETGMAGAEKTIAHLEECLKSHVENGALKEDASFLCLVRKEGEQLK